MPEGGGGGSRRKRRQRGFEHCVDSSVAAGKGAGKTTVWFLLRGQLDTQERCPEETEDRPRILANAQAWLGHRAAVCGSVVTDTVGAGKYQVHQGFALGLRRPQGKTSHV